MASAPGPTFQQFNPFPPSEAPGYDILLSLSQKRLQKQLQKLYTTSIDPPPGSPPQVPKQYLISHQLRLLLPRTSKKDPSRVFTDVERVGILGHILCPEIILVPGKNRLARLKFTFTTAADGDFKAPYSTDSVLQQFDEDNKIYTTKINGWSFSFEVDLSTSKPMHIMNDILKLANDPKDSVILPEKTKAEFQKLADITSTEEKIDSRSFLASSIFCLFQSTQISNSFTVSTDKGGQLSVDEFETIDTFNKTVCAYFTTLRSSGLPTTDNPFVLGYAITQELPTMAQANPDATTDKTPKYLIPRRYDMSVTAAPAGFGVSGAINFHLQTFREKAQDQIDVDILKHPNAGTAYYTAQQNITPNGIGNSYDGVMVLSRKTFLDFFAVDTFGSKLGMDAEKLLKSMGCKSATLQRSGVTQFKEDESRWQKTAEWRGQTEIDTPNKFQMTFKEFNCSTSVTINCFSDWSKAVAAKKEADMKSDSKREAYISVSTETVTTMAHSVMPYADTGDSNLLGGLWTLLGSKVGGGAPNQTHKIITTQRYKYDYKLVAGDAGAWSVSLEDSSVQPHYKTSTELDWTRVEDEPSSSTYGTFLHIVKSEVQSGIEGIFNLDSISQDMASAQLSAGKTVVDEMLKTLSSITDTFKTTIILPAGDAFMFKDLDTDKFGNLYSNVTYATPQGGKAIPTATK